MVSSAEEVSPVPEIPGARSNNVMQKLGRDKYPSPPKLCARKPSTLGQFLDMPFAAGEQYRCLLMSVDRWA
jgi:hypothetical protein